MLPPPPPLQADTRNSASPMQSGLAAIAIAENVFIDAPRDRTTVTVRFYNRIAATARQVNDAGPEFDCQLTLDFQKIFRIRGWFLLAQCTGDT